MNKYPYSFPCLFRIQSDFVWSLKSENETDVSDKGIDQFETSQSKNHGFLILSDDFTNTRTYYCVANNSIGAGQSCQIEVTGILLLNFSVLF